MSTHKRFSTLFSFAVLLLVVGAAWPESTPPVDGNHIPIVVTPGALVVSPGDSVQVSVTLDGVTTVNQTVALDSNSSALSVPSTVTVLAGHSSASFNAYAPANSGLSSNVTATITAACNNAGADADVVVAP